MYRVTMIDGEVFETDGKGLNMAVIHDYDDEIVRIEKIS